LRRTSRWYHFIFFTLGGRIDGAFKLCSKRRVVRVLRLRVVSVRTALVSMVVMIGMTMMMIRMMEPSMRIVA
jgi:hypothetical protein